MQSLAREREREREGSADPNYSWYCGTLLRTVRLEAVKYQSKSQATSVEAKSHDVGTYSVRPSLLTGMHRKRKQHDKPPILP